MVKVLHLSDIHLGSGLAHGHINPATGINTRLEDFVQTLERCIDEAIAQSVDLVLFGGDAFPDATPPPLHQDLFAQQFRRLADAQIPTVLLVGNHDQYAQGQEGSSLSIYRTLGVLGFYVGDTLQTFHIETASGPVQVTTIPWLTRSTFLSRQETLGLSAEVIGMQLLQRLHVALEAEIRQLDSTLPAILLVHAMVDTAAYGAERYLAVGKGFTVPLHLIARPAFQYVALGHVHQHQVLNQDPLVIYPGSMERVDFGEEDESKGFILAEVTVPQTTFEFKPLPVRPFKTVRVDVTDLPRLPDPDQSHPQHRILDAIQAHSLTGSIVRLIYRIRPDQLEAVDETVFHAALAEAFSYSIAPDVVSTLRTRLPDLDPTQVEPLEALRHYLDAREDLVGLKEDMLVAAQQVLHDVDWLEYDLVGMDPEDDKDPELPAAQQLRLL